MTNRELNEWMRQNKMGSYIPKYYKREEILDLKVDDPIVISHREKVMRETEGAAKWLDDHGVPVPQRL